MNMPPPLTQFKRSLVLVLVHRENDIEIRFSGYYDFQKLVFFPILTYIHDMHRFISIKTYILFSRNCDIKQQHANSISDALHSAKFNSNKKIY